MTTINYSSNTHVGADSKLVKLYADEFKNMSGYDIGKKLFKQVSGWSDSKKTLSMFDAIPEDKLYEAVSSFNQTDRIAIFSFSYANSNEVRVEYPNLFDALNSESGIGAKELKPRLCRYLDSKYKNGDISKSYYEELKKIINSGIDGKDYDSSTICELECKFGSLEYYQTTSIFGNKYYTHRSETAY